jgi:hypothetical protein
MDRCWTLVLQPTPELFWGSDPVVWNLHYRRRVSLVSAVHLVVQRLHYNSLLTCYLPASNRIFEGWQWVGVISPVFVYSLLRFGSGVPLLERRSNVKWGSDPAYVAYLERVSCASCHFHKQNINPPTLTSPTSTLPLSAQTSIFALVPPVLVPCCGPWGCEDFTPDPPLQSTQPLQTTQGGGDYRHV